MSKDQIWIPVLLYLFGVYGIWGGDGLFWGIIILAFFT